ncbi:protease subunit of ATP-dependent protease [Schinkia azotoformans MEV2011]|uniref:ATP-dependent Clp protease proteolytic subunit n=1 Tax=Schinkia azotoformans MEV2011 TaxID=1348973 RepID=A0A072NSE0_SCHAZ|nr:head maturation protease, ClpP-related [Schinkia azotoformans]KEF40122.1 protease subunit of ATP-dependent protease [Schinkia azotoformans MEV2011]
MKNKIQAIPYQFLNKVNESEDEHEMVLSGYIGRSSWWYEAISAESIRKALNDVTASTIRIKLNSGGGEVDQGVEIYNYLKDLDKRVVVEVTSLAASAASIAAMGADEIIMRTGSRMMIHEASTLAYGNKQDIQKTLNALEAYDESIISIYQQRTGKSREEITNLLEAETWFTAEQAVKEGFADKVEFNPQPVEPQNGVTDEQMQQIINAVTNNLKQNQNDEPTPPAAPQAKRKGFIF